MLSSDAARGAAAFWRKLSKDKRNCHSLKLSPRVVVRGEDRMLPLEP
jgi:hypothetical protein